jgi:hypothetical protein
MRTLTTMHLLIEELYFVILKAHLFFLWWFCPLNSVTGQCFTA